MIASGIEQRHILLLDDDAEERKSLKHGLKSLGLTDISEADDPIAALEIMRARPVDLLICEHYIPFVWFLRTNVKRPAAYTPILMLSRQHRREDIREAVDCGVNRFLAKPIAPEELLEHIRQVFEDPEAFVESAGYIGPDRRRRGNVSGRRSKATRRMEEPALDTMLTPEEIAALLER
ncbi:MAG: response regulator [Rhodospirillales bacterium]